MKSYSITRCSCHGFSISYFVNSCIHHFIEPSTDDSNVLASHESFEDVFGFQIKKLHSCHTVISHLDDINSPQYNL